VAASRAATETSGRQFDMPIEFPANMRELAQEAVAQTRENYEQVEIAANELVSTLVSTQSTAARSIANYRAWLMEGRAPKRDFRFRFCPELGHGKVGTRRDRVYADARARPTRCPGLADQ
jgi:hypothetical protein